MSKIGELFGLREKLMDCQRKLSYLRATEDDSWSNQRDQVDEQIDELLKQEISYKKQISVLLPDFKIDY